MHRHFYIQIAASLTSLPTADTQRIYTYIYKIVKLLREIICCSQSQNKKKINYTSPNSIKSISYINVMCGLWYLDFRVIIRIVIFIPTRLFSVTSYKRVQTYDFLVL